MDDSTENLSATNLCDLINEKVSAAREGGGVDDIVELLNQLNNHQIESETDLIGHITVSQNLLLSLAYSLDILSNTEIEHLIEVVLKILDRPVVAFDPIATNPERMKNLH